MALANKREEVKNKDENQTRSPISKRSAGSVAQNLLADAVKSRLRPATEGEMKKNTKLRHRATGFVEKPFFKRAPAASPTMPPATMS